METLEIIRQELGEYIEKLDRLDSLGLDSLDMLSLVNEIETEIGVQVPPEALVEMVTVGDLCAYVDTYAHV